MSLPSTYTSAYGAIPKFFNQIRDGQAPDKFTQQILKDLGYKSKNHRAFIPLMKALGFLTPEGVPTKRYHAYRGHANSKRVMGEAVQEAYSDIFLIKARPTQSDADLIKSKFKSFHNVSENVANLMTKTFFSVLKLADLQAARSSTEPEETISEEKEDTTDERSEDTKEFVRSEMGLHYNIQIHLPATKDLEVYNAIFKSLKDHLVN